MFCKYFILHVTTVLANFVFIFQIFVAMARVNWNYVIKLPDPENSCLLQESETCLLHKPSYSEFCVKIFIFFGAMTTRFGLGKLE